MRQFKLILGYFIHQPLTSDGGPSRSSRHTVSCVYRDAIRLFRYWPQVDKALLDPLVPIELSPIDLLRLLIVFRIRLILQLRYHHRIVFFLPRLDVARRRLCFICVRPVGDWHRVVVLLFPDQILLDVLPTGGASSPTSTCTPCPVSSVELLWRLLARFLDETGSDGSDLTANSA